MKKNNSFFHTIFQPQYLLIWALVVLIAVLCAVSPAFRSKENIVEIFRSAGIYGIMVLGLTWIVALGEMDVTFPDIAAFGSMIVAFLIFQSLPWVLTMLIAIVISAVWGLLTGVLINVFKVRALIASVAVATIAKSLAYVIGQGSPIYLNAIDPGMNFLVYGKIAGIPLLVILVVIIYIIAAFLENRTKLGQYLYALGENRQAALEAGIPEKPIIYSFYILSAALAAASGTLMVASYTSGQPNFLGTYFVDGLSIVFLGALVIKIGKPNVIGTLIGAVMIMVISNGSTLLGIPFYVGIIVKGLLMVAGVAAISASKNKSMKIAKAERLAMAKAD